MSAALWQHGLRPGQTVGVYAYNPPESLFLQLAAHLFGARTAWVAPSAPPRFRNDFIRLAGIDAFVYDAVEAAEYGGEMARLAAPLPVLCFGTGGAGPTSPPARAETWRARCRSIRRACRSSRPRCTRPAAPRACRSWCHHRQSFFQALREMAEAYRQSDAPRLRHLLSSGSWHVSAQTAAFLTLFSGGTLLLPGRRDTTRLAQGHQAEKVNSTLLMPAQLYELLDDPLLETADTSSLQTLSISGGPAAPARLEAAIQRFGPVIRLVYGMSESPFLTAQPT